MPITSVTSSSGAPSSFGPNLSQNRGLLQCAFHSRQMAKILELQHETPEVYSRFMNVGCFSAAVAAESLQSCPTLCDPIDGSPPGSPVPGILQARTLEWVAISSNAWKGKVKVKSLSCVQLFMTLWTVAYQAPPSMGFPRHEYWSRVPLPSPRKIIALIRWTFASHLYSKAFWTIDITNHLPSFSLYLIVDPINLDITDLYLCVIFEKTGSESVNCLVVSISLWPHGLTRLLCPWDSPGMNTGVGCHVLLQGNLPKPGIEPGSPALQAESTF